MKSLILQLSAKVLMLTALSASAAIRYVNVNSANPASPYTNWTIAATTIQDAVDAAVAGDQILVTNGVYETGGRAVVGTMTNRVAVNKPVRVQSVNGATATVIRGFQVPGTTNGDSTIRCVYLASGAALVGFTLANGATRGSGEYREQIGGGVWCETTSAVVSNCTLSGNSAAESGGGAYGGTLNHCTLTANSAHNGGGGASGGTLNHCTLTGNSNQVGGGAYNCTLNNCILTGNSAGYLGGGAYESTLNNCAISHNSAWYGGGAEACTLNNCTLTGNSAGYLGGGAYESTLNNCIVYYNSAQNGDNYSNGSLSHSCTTPIPPGGVDNISAEPQLADLSHLSAGSPCRGAGSAAYATGLDMDGEPWANPPSIGCDEYHSSAVIGPLNVSIQAAYTDVTVGFAVNFTAAMEGRATANRWDFGDGTVVSNRSYVSHSWAVAGDYSVVFQAYNNSNRGGVSATFVVHVTAQPVHYVALSSANPVAPYTSWATAATNIQDAVDATSVAGALVLVTNGVYHSGERWVIWPEGGGNRLAVTKQILVRSVNGAAVTVIDGEGAVRCVYLSNGATLVGFTLTNGIAHYSSGGGVQCESASAKVSNCVLTGNSAGSGGGVTGGTLNNCTIIGNSASVGGGANESTLNNCIVYYNNAQSGDNYSSGSLNYCCTSPLPPGLGNISTEPGLADSFHLSADSPSRGAGSAAYATGQDMDGEPWANPPAIGCDEYHPRVITGPLSVSIQADYTNVAVGFVVNFTAGLDGSATANRWDFGDGTVVSNRPSASHSWTVAGDYSVVFQAYNDAYLGAVSTALTVHVAAQPIHYVALSSANPVAPYTNWLTAADNIQDAVDAASVAGALVLVTNGVYQNGGRMVSEAEAITNRVAVTRALIVRSVNGTAATMIKGYRDPVSIYASGVLRCVYLAKGAALVGFTLINGAADFGGGVWCESANAVVSNCVFSFNSARGPGGGANGGTLNNCTFTTNSAGRGAGVSFATLNNCTLTGNSTCFCYGDGPDGFGGGAYASAVNNCILTGNTAIHGGGASFGTLNNCKLSGNSGELAGGGAYSATLNNCTLISNSGGNDGGGASHGTLNNCIVYYNTAGSGANHDSFASLNYCCTTPLPTEGTGNLNKPPLFVNQSAGNLRLQSNSPCINGGYNGLAPAGPDPDANPRIVGGTVDIGAYEFQSPQSLISYAWLQQYGLPIDGSADYTDADGDGLNNWQEWRAGTNPTNSLSALRLLSPAAIASGIIVSWQSVSGRNYFLERGIDLRSHPVFFPLATHILGQPGTTSYTDTNSAGPGSFYYRVGVAN